jgi:hypothetical protein
VVEGGVVVFCRLVLGSLAVVASSVDIVPDAAAMIDLASLLGSLRAVDLVRAMLVVAGGWLLALRPAAAAAVP